MIRIDQLPEKAIDAARLAMAIALARDGDGIPEAIVAAINAWPNGGLHVPVGVGEPRKSFTLPALILPITESTND